LGAVFLAEGLVLNYLKYQGLNLAVEVSILAFAISWATAFSEELVFRGYIFTRLWQGFKNELFANFLTSAAWMTIHIPVTIFVLDLNLMQMLVFLALTGIFSLGSSFLFARTKNIFGSVILHVLWQWPIILFR
jgi:membrane protease YdiL (CAAX protease family)